ncbi:IS110 family transposase [Streptomyces chartreusis]
MTGRAPAIHNPACPGPASRGQEPRERDSPTAPTAGPELLGLLGVGPITAALLPVSRSHPAGPAEAAFDSCAGVSPIPASSGPANHHRIKLQRRPQLNRVRHTITLTRRHLDPATKTYVARRAAERQDLTRCATLPQASHRGQPFKILERPGRSAGTEPQGAS